MCDYVGHEFCAGVRDSAQTDVRFLALSGHSVRRAVCQFLTHSGHCSQPFASRSVRCCFLGTVAVLPPISAPHVIASQSDALRNLQVLSEEWLVDTL